MRDDKWLENTMYELWEDHFNDIPRKNMVIIKFSKKSSRQLGAIMWLNKKTKVIERIISEQPPSDEPKITLILITSYFKDPLIPDIVVKGTIAHELCHYSHGFSSPLKQLYSHPHKGGIIRKELSKRGLGDLYTDSKKWLKVNWQGYLRYIRSVS